MTYYDGNKADFWASIRIVGIFEGIFSQVPIDGVETTGVFEPVT
ncbi:hypothetical protein [Candidatus Contubernalis alkaliaceticus]|nr:hypothetical protein [Candidatus Contubernalis alkalaceticus]